MWIKNFRTRIINLSNATDIDVDINIEITAELSKHYQDGNHNCR